MYVICNLFIVNIWRKNYQSSSFDEVKHFQTRLWN